MITDQLNQLVKNWILENIAEGDLLEDFRIYLNGDDAPVDAPFIGIMETGAETFTQGEVVMHGIHEVSLSIVLSTIPVGEHDGGTSPDDHREMTDELWNILGDRSILAAAHDGVRLFDFRAVNPTTEAADGRRVTTIQITAVACPI
jgi:hypothetical protein